MQTAASSGLEYLQTLSSTERRENGQVFTPRYLVSFILEIAGYEASAPIEEQTLLDPACGAGAFLERAVELLGSRLEHQGYDLRIGAGRRRLLELVASRLFGVDIDSQACELARKSVRAAVFRLTGVELHPTFFAANVICADFLALDGLACFPCSKVDYIVGNPPYVSTETQTEAYRFWLRSRFASATGRFDLYMLFMEHSLIFLKEGGQLAFITPDKFLLSEAARPLRRIFLERAAIRVLATFRSHKVFSEAAIVPCITVFERSERRRAFQLLSCASQPDADGRIKILARSAHPNSSLTSAPWNTKGPELLELARIVSARHPSLAQRTLRMSAGPATGRDKIYVRPSNELAGIEPELIRSGIRGRDLVAFGALDPGLSLLLPYEFDAAGRPRLVDLAGYPEARRYLEPHRPELASRHCVRIWGNAWYDFHDQPFCDLALMPKILVPDIARSNRFVADPGRYFPLHSVYYMVPRTDQDIDYLTAILNSTPVEFLLRLHAPRIKDGFSRYRKQFLATLPIPDASPDEIRTIGRLSRIDWQAAENRIARLFALNAREIAEMRAFLVDLDDVHS